MRKVSALTLVTTLSLVAVARAQNYPWPLSSTQDQTLEHRIAPPRGYNRLSVEEGSFASWLRNLPLKPGRPPVLLYNGELKPNQEAHYAIIDMDVGERDLQQCADAVMRLRAEYLHASGRDVRFHFTSGDECALSRWEQGYRPVIKGNNVSWSRSAVPDNSYGSFRKYLDVVFQYAGSASLSRELHSVSVKDLQIGDVFIRGGFPGHAVLVADMAENSSGKKTFLMLQSYMPAQEIHVLKNPESNEMGPWYPLDFGDTLNTPEWTFASNELKRF